jgi:hypothetical protein
LPKRNIYIISHRFIFISTAVLFVCVFYAQPRELGGMSNEQVDDLKSNGE